ncbi:MAG TPA: HAMP domain-containing protein, partial [Polyangiaceae bacterium]|nr:HAMP domain-containing protein [Polyangiaceae bacterium]
MQLTFRAKLLLIVGTATLALVLVVGGSSLIASQQARDLADVEGRLVPKLELGPRLESEFDHLRQSLQDAVAAQDSAALDAGLAAKDKMFALVNSGTGALTTPDAAALRWAINEYYESAHDVSRRLIAGETGEGVVADMAKMQTRQAKLAALIKQTTRLDRRELAGGFAAVRANNERATRFRQIIGLCALLAVITLSLWTGTGVLKTLGHLSRGFSRFATGKFDEPIPIIAQDELGNLAREANQMAASLQQLGEQRDRNDWLRTGQAGLSDELHGELEPKTVAKRALWFLARRIG